MKQIYNTILGTFENEDIKEFAKKCIDTAPPYVFKVAASSTGKYHPQFALGDGGLARHTVALVRILNHIFGVESVANKFTSRERDLLRVAGIAHDMMKSGTQEEYEKNKYTKFDHPLRAANMVRDLKGLPIEEKEYIASAIESHMGQWNESKRDPGIILPKPETDAQILLHVCDYLASRKDIDVKFDAPIPEVKQKKDVDPSEYILRFGKYCGLTWPEVEKEDPGYIDWAKTKEGRAFDVLRDYLKEKK